MAPWPGNWPALNRGILSTAFACCERVVCVTPPVPLSLGADEPRLGFGAGAFMKRSGESQGEFHPGDGSDARADRIEQAMESLGDQACSSCVWRNLHVGM